MEAKNLKSVSGASMPLFSISKVGGGMIEVGKAQGWQAVFVYRGKHCPICRRFLTELNSTLDQFVSLGVEVVAISADTKEKAESEAKEEGWNISIGYDLSIEQMRKLGLYISSPKSDDETDRPFAEPALFVINPEHTIQIINLSSSPAARPNLPTLLQSLKFTIEKKMPPRGTFECS